MQAFRRHLAMTILYNAQIPVPQILVTFEMQDAAQSFAHKPAKDYGGRIGGEYIYMTFSI